MRSSPRGSPNPAPERQGLPASWPPGLPPAKTSSITLEWNPSAHHRTHPCPSWVDLHAHQDHSKSPQSQPGDSPSAHCLLLSHSWSLLSSVNIPHGVGPRPQPGSSHPIWSRTQGPQESLKLLIWLEPCRISSNPEWPAGPGQEKPW